MKVENVPLFKISTKDRARKEMGEVGELAESMRRLGLLQPIVLQDDYTLMAGERRLQAAQLLKWETIPVVFLSSLSEIERLEVELHENKKRKDFTWPEEVALVERIHLAKVKADPSWKHQDTADKTDTSTVTHHKDLALAKAVREHPELLKMGKKDAYRKMRRMKERELRELLVDATLGEGVDLEKPMNPLYSVRGVTLHHLDCVKGIQELPDESIDLVMTDFPFGVDLDKNFDFNKTWDEVYADKQGSLLEGLLPSLAEQFTRVLKPGAHFYIFYPSLFHDEFRRELSSHLSLYPIPLIWNKRTGGTSFAPYSKYTPNYEPLWYGWKGQTPRKLTSPGYCVLNFDNLHKKAHPAEKPVNLISYLIEQSTIEGETVLDTFSGSGVTLESCVRMNRRGVAFELSKSWFELGVERLKTLDMTMPK